MKKLSKIKITLIATVAAYFYITTANAAIISLESSVNLAPLFNSSSSNYHPQGLGFDTGTGELLYMQQSEQRIDRSNTSGVFTGSTALTNSPNHTTSVAADATNYYYSDYTGNSNLADLFAQNKSTGVRTQISSEIAAYGGYPIDVRDGKMYRTEISTGYSWSNLSTIRISDLGSIDSIDQTVTLATTFGIGDFGIDALNNEVWVLDYNANAAIRRFDLSTGALLDVFALGLDGLDAGLTYADGKLYVYDWVQNGPSTLSTYSVSGVTVTPAVPAPAGLPLMMSAMVVLFGLAKKYRPEFRRKQ